MLDGGGQIVRTDVEDLGGGLDAQRVSLAQPTVDVNPPARRPVVTSDYLHQPAQS